MSKTHALGFILIELLIATVISSTLILALCEIYIVQQRSVEAQKRLQEINAAAETAIHHLISSVKQAGYIGCQRLQPATTITNHVPFEITDDNKITGDQHQLIVRYALFTGATLQQMSKDGKTIYITKTIGFTPNSKIFISDCKHAELNQIEAITVLKNQIKIELMAPLKYAYDQSAEIDLFVMNHLFLKEDKLWLENIDHQKQVISDDLKSFVITYYLQDGSKKEMIQNSNNVIGVSFLLTFKKLSLEKQWIAYATISSV